LDEGEAMSNDERSDYTHSEHYLGDGLYASFDGWFVRLRAPRETTDHWVALEPAVFRKLLQFVEMDLPRTALRQVLVDFVAERMRA
jgi:hypothetical protein